MRSHPAPELLACRYASSHKCTCIYIGQKIHTHTHTHTTKSIYIATHAHSKSFGTNYVTYCKAIYLCVWFGRLLWHCFRCDKPHWSPQLQKEIVFLLIRCFTEWKNERKIRWHILLTHMVGRLLNGVKRPLFLLFFLIYFLSLCCPNRAKSNVLYNLHLTAGLWIHKTWFPFSNLLTLLELINNPQFYIIYKAKCFFQGVFPLKKE